MEHAATAEGLVGAALIERREAQTRWAILLGVVTTAKRHGLDVQAYLTWIFERRGTGRD